MANLNCGLVRYGLPDTCKKGNQFSMMAGAYFVSHGTSFTVAQAMAISNYTAKVITKALLPVHGVFAVEDLSTEKSVTTSPMNRKKKNNDGYRGYRLSFDLTKEQAEALKSWEGSSMDIIPYDVNGIISFTSPDGTNLYGFEIDYFDVEKGKVVTEANAALTTVEIQESDPDEWDLYGFWVQPKKNTLIADRWNPSQVKSISLLEVTATAVAANASTITLKVPTKEMQNGVVVKKGVTGASEDNIKLYTNLGVEVTTHTLTATSTAGEYTLANTTLVAGYYFYYLALAADEKLFESPTVTLT